METIIQSLKNLIKANSEDDQDLRESLNKVLYVLKFTTHPKTMKILFELHFGRKPGTKLTNLKNAILVDSKEFFVYITRNSAEQIKDHLMMSKKKTNDPKYRRGMTFTQNKKQSNTVSTNVNSKYPFTFFRKGKKKKSSLDSKLV